MDYGKIIEEGQPAALVKKHVGEEVLEIDNDEKTVEMLREKFPKARFEAVGDRVSVFTTEHHGVFTEFLERNPLKNSVVRNANLEDVFLKLTGRRLRE
jgi:lipooligosaccharide transport system ATP-binding protein